VKARFAGAALVAAAVLAVAGCGGGEDSGTPQGDVGGPTIGVSITLADCTDWQDATVEERLGTIEQIANFAGGAIPGQGEVSRATLDPDRAYEVMEGYCEQEFARGFKLYKLYTRAAAFEGVEAPAQ
jgi:hypothetical protein